MRSSLNSEEIFIFWISKLFHISGTTTVKVNNKVVHNEEEIQKKKYSKNMKIFDIFVMYCQSNCDYVLNVVFYFEFETIKWYPH